MQMLCVMHIYIYICITHANAVPVFDLDIRRHIHIASLDQNELGISSDLVMCDVCFSNIEEGCIFFCQSELKK